jgi:hypothetical protein
MVSIKLFMQRYRKPMVSISLYMQGYRKPVTMNGLYRPMPRAIGIL